MITVGTGAVCVPGFDLSSKCCIVVNHSAWQDLCLFCGGFMVWNVMLNFSPHTLRMFDGRPCGFPLFCLVSYRADWEPAATSGRRALGVFWRCPAVLWGPSTPNPTQVSWETLILKNWPIFLRHVDMWWFCPMWPKCAFGDQKGLIRIKDMPFGNPPYHRTKVADCEKSRFHFYL